jgi:uncharacterized protein
MKGKKRSKRRKPLRVPSPEKIYGEDLGRGNRILIVILIIVMAVLTVTMLINLLKSERLMIVKQQEFQYYYPKFISFGNGTYISMYLPAVDNNGEGIITTLGVETVPGSGRILVDIENLVFWEDTQNSMRTAKEVAGKITNKNVTDYDFVYTVHTNATMVGGPSAGAAITVATIAALENKSINENVMITGAIKSDGSISKVTGISAKAKAAKQINISTFLVPPGQSTETYYEIKKDCQGIGSFEFCTVKQVPKERDISREVGIAIIEVPTVEEALRYFFK